MSEQDPQIRRVTFELPDQDVPELMATLGDFAASHNINVEVGDADPDSSEPSLRVEDEPKYNPERVTWVTDPNTEKQVPVITEANLRAFKRENHPQFKFARTDMLYPIYGFYDIDGRSKTSIEDYFLVEAPSTERVDTRIRIIGMRAEKAIELLLGIREGRIAKKAIDKRFNPKLVKLFEEYCEELYMDEEALSYLDFRRDQKSD